jgi:mRNA interferase RelE/StbE
MKFEIVLAPEAVNDLRRLNANVRGRVRDGIELHLRHEPSKESRSRIKRLKGIRRPQFRLRIDDIRVFYDIAEATVEVLAIVNKQEAQEWLARVARTE